MTEHDAQSVYEPPMLVEIGDFAEETHGFGTVYPEGGISLLTLPA